MYFHRKKYLLPIVIVAKHLFLCQKSVSKSGKSKQDKVKQNHSRWSLGHQPLRHYSRVCCLLHFQFAYGKQHSIHIPQPLIKHNMDGSLFIRTKPSTLFPYSWTLRPHQLSWCLLCCSCYTGIPWASQSCTCNKSGITCILQVAQCPRSHTLQSFELFIANTFR